MEPPPPSYETTKEEGPVAPTTSHTIARKPVAPAAVGATSTYYEPPPPQEQTRSTYSGRRRPTLASRLQMRRRWCLLTKRTRILIIVGIAALIILILGLGIGLGTRSKSENLPLPDGNGGPFQGEFTYYDPGLGACGVTSTSSENIVAIAHSLYDAAQEGSDPNQNPLCGRRIRARRYKEGVGERSVDLTVVDRCTGCKPTDIDVSLSAFEKLADQDLGRVDVEWNWID